MASRRVRETYSQIFRAPAGYDPSVASCQNRSDLIRAIRALNLVALIGVTMVAAQRSSRLGRMMTFQLRITSASTDSSGRWTDCVSITSESVAEAIERSLTMVAATLSDGKREATLHDLFGRLLWMAEPKKFFCGSRAQTSLVGTDSVDRH